MRDHLLALQEIQQAPDAVRKMHQRLMVDAGIVCNVS
jgi:hypothetical protein